MPQVKCSTCDSVSEIDYATLNHRMHESLRCLPEAPEPGHFTLPYDDNRGPLSTFMPLEQRYFLVSTNNWANNRKFRIGI